MIFLRKMIEYSGSDTPFQLRDMAMPFLPVTSRIVDGHQQTAPGEDHTQRDHRTFLCGARFQRVVQQIPKYTDQIGVFDSQTRWNLRRNLQPGTGTCGSVCVGVQQRVCHWIFAELG